MSETKSAEVVDLSKPAGEGMVRVTFLPEGKTVEFEFDTLPYEGHGEPMSFLDVAENFDIFLGTCLWRGVRLYDLPYPCEGGGAGYQRAGGHWSWTVWRRRRTCS